MNAPGALLLMLAGVGAVADWIAVGVGNRRAEYALKPLTLVALVGAAAVVDADDPSRQSWFVVALLLCLLGDVLLMLPVDAFVAGLAAFLVGHLAYIVGFATDAVSVAGVALGAAVVAIVGQALGPRILAAATRRDRALRRPVAVYIVVISAMVAAAFGSTIPLAIAGALLFYASDAQIAWSRFVRDYPGARVGIMSTYHLGQLLLVLSLV